MAQGIYRYYFLRIGCFVLFFWSGTDCLDVADKRAVSLTTSLSPPGAIRSPYYHATLIPTA